MSKFNAKNLSYESNEPSFLRKLRGEYGGTDGTRHERPLARPRKMVTEGDDDDQPTFVMEESQDTMSKEEYDALVRDSEDIKRRHDKQQTEVQAPGKQLQKEEGNDEKQTSEPAREQVAAIGGAKKKRNIVALGADQNDSNQQVKDEKTHKSTKAKKGKKVKLSFDEA